MPALSVARPRRQGVWRVGYRPDPFAWSDWSWASEGRFGGRWDDRDGNFRTLYVGSSLLACLLEVLAGFRADPVLSADLAVIDLEDGDEALFPTSPPGVVDPSWLAPRAAGSAHLTGDFCSVTTSVSLAVLHPRFVTLAVSLGLADFDAAAIKDGRPRLLTQSIATHLYATTDLDGIRFGSRHGDDLELWAVFERHDGPVSPCLTERASLDLDRDDPALRAAFDTLGLRWSDDPDGVAPHGASDAPAGGSLPLPLAVVDDETAAAAIYRDGVTPFTPVGAATLWCSALADPAQFAVWLTRLSVDVTAWGDFSEAWDVLGGLSLVQHPIPAAGSPDRIAHVKFIDTGNTSGQAFGDASLDDFRILTLVKNDDGWWQAWKISHNYIPSNGDVAHP